MSTLWENWSCHYVVLLLIWSVFYRAFTTSRKPSTRKHGPSSSTTILNFFPRSSSPLVKLATLEMTRDKKWYLDFGATHHLTLNLNNLMTKLQFLSYDEVFMGNSKGLLIHHIGHTSFSLSFIFSKTLALKQLLHAPMNYKKSS